MEKKAMNIAREKARVDMAIDKLTKDIAELQAEIDQTEQGKRMIALRKSKQTQASESGALKQELKTLGTELYLQDGNKQLPFGTVRVKVVSSITDRLLAYDWAKDNMPILLQTTLNETELLAIAHNSPALVPPHLFIEESEVITVYIKSDLSDLL